MKAMVLGGVAPHISLIERLKNRGFEVILIDYLDDPPAKNFADRFIQESTLDVDKVREIAQAEQVDVIMTTNVDHANVTMCMVAEQLDLPHPYSLEVAQMTTNKALMKARMREGGIPTSPYFSVQSIDEVPWDDLTFPLVVKPADNNGSKGVKRVDDAESLREGVLGAIELSRSRTAIIEGFNEGREIQIDCVANEGRAHILTIREKLKIPRTDGFAMQVYGSVVPAELPSALVEEYHAIAQKIVDAFGLEHTPFFFQSITDGTNVNVLELSPRIGGGLSYKMIKDSVGVDVIEIAIDSYFGNIPQFSVEPAGVILASTIVYAKNGTFARLTGIDELKEDGTIVDWDQIASTGTAFGSYMDSRNRVGAYYSSATDYAQLKAKTRKAEATMDVLDENGNSIKVSGLCYN